MSNTELHNVKRNWLWFENKQLYSKIRTLQQCPNGLGPSACTTGRLFLGPLLCWNG
jgi:hypothetical protein